jgi:hypothetical protein
LTEPKSRWSMHPQRPHPRRRSPDRFRNHRGQRHRPVPPLRRERRRRDLLEGPTASPRPIGDRGACPLTLATSKTPVVPAPTRCRSACVIRDAIAWRGGCRIGGTSCRDRVGDARLRSYPGG